MSIDQIIRNTVEPRLEQHMAAFKEQVGSGFYSIIDGEVTVKPLDTTSVIADPNFAFEDKFWVNKPLIPFDDDEGEKNHDVIIRPFDVYSMPIINWQDVCGGHFWEDETELLLDSSWYTPQASDDWLYNMLMEYMEFGHAISTGIEYSSEMPKAHNSSGRVIYPRYSESLKFVVYDFAHIPTRMLNMWIFNTSQFSCLGDASVRDPINQCADDINKFLMPIVQQVGYTVCDYDSFTITQMGFLVAGCTILVVAFILLCCIIKKKNKRYQAQNMHKRRTSRPRTRYSQAYGAKEVILLKKNQNDNDTVYVPADDLSMNSGKSQFKSKRKNDKHSESEDKSDQSHYLVPTPGAQSSGELHY